MYCCQLWFNSTKDSLNKLKTSYNSALRRFLVPYNANQMFASRGILSFDELLRKSIYDYSAPLWGTQSVSCISAVQNRACRYFLGIGRYAPNAAVNGDMCWSAPEHKQWICVTRKWCRLTNMAD